MTSHRYYSREVSTLYFIQYLQDTATIYTYFEHVTEVGCYMVSSMVTSFLGSVEVVVKAKKVHLSML